MWLDIKEFIKDSIIWILIFLGMFVFIIYVLTFTQVVGPSMEPVLKNKDVVKPQDLAMSWYLPFLSREFTQNAFWTWSRDNWEWIKSALGGDMSFDKFVIYPSNVFKTAERLAEYKEFFEPQLDDMAISRNIKMGINEITARLTLIEKDKAAVEAALLAAK